MDFYSYYLNLKVDSVDVCYFAKILLPGSWLRPENGQGQEDKGDEDQSNQPPPTNEIAAAAVLAVLAAVLTAVILHSHLFLHGLLLQPLWLFKKRPCYF